MVETGQRMGKKMVALITDMEQPLGRKVGNALEVEECIDVLAGGGPEDLRELCLDLSAWMFFLGGKSKIVAEGRKLASEMIAAARARDKFREIIRLQGGDAACVDDPSRLPRARTKPTAITLREGLRHAIQLRAGRRCQHASRRRAREEGRFDRSGRGLDLEKKLGDACVAGSVALHDSLQFDYRLRRGA